MKLDSKLYEKIVSRLIFDENDFNITIVPNAKIIGSISGRSRQIDVLLDSKNGESDKRIIVDCKFQKRPIDIKKVEEFEGMMRDVNAQRGILICPSGYTQSALRRAQELITIRILTEEEIENFVMYGWDNCKLNQCEGNIIWEINPSIINDLPLTVTCSAKCDKCSSFNIWCWACGEKFSMYDEDDHQCECEEPSFWLTSIENDEQSKSVYLHYLYLIEYNPDQPKFAILTMNRRPIS